MNQTTHSFSSGNLVLFHGRAAAVTAVAPDKIGIRIEGGAEKNVRPKDVQFLHRGPVTSLPPAPPAQKPDYGELLELLDGETMPFAEFTELAFGENSPEGAWALRQELENGIFFSGSPDSGVTPHTPEEIAEKKAKRDAKNAEAEARRELLERIRSGNTQPEDLRFFREIEAVALGTANSSRLLHDLEIEAVPEKAHKLLLRTGAWDLFRDPWPTRLGIETAPPLLPLPQQEEEAREDLTAMRALAIDDAGSNDPDDAVSFEGGLLYVHVADVAACLQHDSDAAAAACERGTNLYLPEGIVPMLPAGTTERFGLGLQEISPALTFAVSISQDGEAALERMFLSRLHVERMTYEECEAAMDSAPLPQLAAALERFRLRRQKDGALMLKLPEVKIRVHDREIAITPCPVTPARELVANAMLAAGHAVAKFMEKQGSAFPFVVQEPPETEERGEDLCSMYQLRRACPPGCCSCRSGRHSGLALEPYSRVTSPLRRYADLLAHVQLRRIILGKEPIGFEEMDRQLATAENAAAIRRKAEKYANEYWTLVWLSSREGQEFSATLVDKQGDRLTFLLPELAYEYKCRMQTKLRIGDEVLLKLNAADPPALRSSFSVRPAVSAKPDASAL